MPHSLLSLSIMIVIDVPKMLMMIRTPQLKKEVAVTDRMCPCVARWSIIANGVNIHVSVVICAVPQATSVFHTHTASFPL